MISTLRQKKEKLIDAYRQFIGVRDEVANLTVTASRALSSAMDNRVSQQVINEEIAERLRRVEKCILMVAREVEKGDVAEVVIKKR